MNNKNRIGNIYEKALTRINRIHFLTVVITIAGLLFLAMTSPIEAAPGDLDPTFGNGGKVITPFGNAAAALAIAFQPDGKIVTAGVSNSGTSTAPNQDFALIRYNTDGTLDSSFGTGGKVTTDLGSTRELAWAVAIQPDGKIVVAGETGAPGSGSIALARYNPNGTLDSSFGNGGKIVTQVGTYSGVASMALQSDGKIITVGVSNSSTTSTLNQDFAVVRYNPDGTLDNSFGTGGKVITDLGTSRDYPIDVVIQSDGKIIAVGYTFNSSTSYDFALVRYNVNGSLDTSFGSGGKVITQVGNAYDQARDVALQSDGKIVVAGVSQNGTYLDFAVVRYNPDGSLDSSFGTGGKVITPIGSSTDYAEE